MKRMLVGILLINCMLMSLSCGQRQSKSDDPDHPVSKFELVRSQFCGERQGEVPKDPIQVGTLDLESFKKKLSPSGDGVEGLIHAAVHEYGYYVFSFGEVLESFQMSLVPANDSVKEQMRSLFRHDKVRIKGVVLEGPAPVQHILVTDIELVKHFNEDSVAHYTYHSAFPDALREQSEILVKVHAVPSQGDVLVVEWQDVVLPLFVREKQRKLVHQIFRNDILVVRYEIQAHPKDPVHLVLKDQDDALERVDAIGHCHGKDRELSGPLVRFPKSPLLNMATYAVKYVDGNGIERNFTLVGMPEGQDMGSMDFNLFMQVWHKVDDVWQQHQDDKRVARNHYVLPKVKVRVKGTMQNPSRNQANPQLFIRSADDLQFEFLP